MKLNRIKTSVLFYVFLGFYILFVFYKYLWCIVRPFAYITSDFSNYSSWYVSEWLVNYEGGFVRRGLMGELLYMASQITPPNTHLNY